MYSWNDISLHIQYYCHPYEKHGVQYRHLTIYRNVNAPIKRNAKVDHVIFLYTYTYSCIMSKYYILYIYIYGALGAVKLHI